MLDSANFYPSAKIAFFAYQHKPSRCKSWRARTRQDVEIITEDAAFVRD